MPNPWDGHLSGFASFAGMRSSPNSPFPHSRVRGGFDLGGETFTVEPEGFFRSHAILKKGGSTLARVRKPSLLRRRFEISSAGHRLVLENRGWRGREYVLLLGTQEVGRVKREGFSGRKLLLEFPDDVPDFLQVLLAYVVVSQAKREAAAAAAGG